MSDPGTSGVLSPFSKINGLYFNEQNEPDDFMVDFAKDVKRIMESKGVKYLDIEFTNKEDYYTALDNLDNFALENISVYGTSKNKYIITTLEDDPDDEMNGADV